MWAETESWELMKWVCWVWGEKEQLRLGEEGCWAGWGYCLMGQKVLSEMAAAAAVAAVVGLEVVVEVDADVAAPHC